MLRILHSLKFQVICGTSLSIFLIASFSSYFLYQSSTERINRTSKRDLEAFNRLFFEQLNLRTKDLRLALEILLTDEAIVEYFSLRDRDALIEELSPVFNLKLKPEYDITQLHFHLPPATSFLRLHRTQDFGDDLSEWRPSLVRANTERREVAGIEVTRSGPGLKVVYPVVNGGRHIGSVEMATQIATLLEAVASSLSVEYAIGIHTPVWNRARCEDLLDPVVKKDDTIYYKLSNDDLKSLLTEAVVVPGDNQLIDREGRIRAVASFPLKDFTGRGIGLITVVQDVSEAVKMFRNDFIKTESIVASLALVVACILYGSLNRYLFRPLEQGVRFAEEVEVGDLRSEFELGHRHLSTIASTNEIDRLLSSLGRMMSYLRDMARVAASIAEGKLGVAVKPSSSADAFGKAFRRMTENLRQTISDVQTAADTVAVSAAQIGGSAESIAQGTYEQFSATEKTAGTIAEMVRQIETLAKSAQDLAFTVSDASSLIQDMGRGVDSVARDSGEVLASVQETAATMADMSGSMERIAEKVWLVDGAAREATREASEDGVELGGVLRAIGVSSRDIVGIVRIIEGVADQTNLLALNAAIEAAHAGEAGKGFVVVADAIKVLAERSKKATQQVSELVAAVQRSTKEGVELSEVVLARMVDSVTRVTDLVTDVANLMREQGVGAEQILSRADRMQKRTQDMASELQRQAQDARKLLDGVALMRKMTEQVADASSEQKRGADQVAQAIGEIARVARQNLSANKELTNSITSLEEEARRLKTTAGAFEL